MLCEWAQSVSLELVKLRKESSHAHEYKLSNNNKVIVEHVVVEE